VSRRGGSKVVDQPTYLHNEVSARIAVDCWLRTEKGVERADLGAFKRSRAIEASSPGAASNGRNGDLAFEVDERKDLQGVGAFEKTWAMRGAPSTRTDASTERSHVGPGGRWHVDKARASAAPVLGAGPRRSLVHHPAPKRPCSKVRTPPGQLKGDDGVETRAEKSEEAGRGRRTKGGGRHEEEA
jgi:hypothetical protein